MLEHSLMAEMRNRHPDWIWNRSDSHIILGVPGSHEAFKTPVEPGNCLSPGVRSYGVSTWVYVGGTLHAPEEKPLSELAWRYLDGYIPVAIATWQAGEVRVSSRLFAEGDAGLSDIKDYLTVELQNPTPEHVEFTFYLVIRSFGAGGGPLKSLAYEDGAVHVNGAPVIFPDQPPTGFGALSYASTGSDISVWLRRGELPPSSQVIDESTWASGAMAYRVALGPQETQRLEFAFHVHANHHALRWLRPVERPLELAVKERAFTERWHNLLTAKLDLPDKRFTEAFNVQLSHLYMFTVDDEPRITPVSYPLWWLRDGAYVVVALDKGGFHDFAERACKAVAHRDAFGGFGAEGDGPSESIWMLSEHYLLTRSQEYLRAIYPHLERKAELIRRMRYTPTPIKLHSEFRTPECMLNPESDLLCLPAQDGLIQGRMDHHFPIMWVNGFAYLGLTRAALCAEALGLDGSRFEQEAHDLRDALHRSAPALFGKNDRDVNSALWPTGWASKDDALIRERFDEFWNRVRCPGGKHAPELLWTYFEAGQAHNYLLLGQRERAWVSIEHFLSTHIAPGLYTYSEGEKDENSSLLWQRTRGWDRIKYVTPHGWTAAELFLLLRDCLAREQGDALIIGSGIPAAWMREPFEVRNLPTYFGKASFSFEPKDNVLTVEVETSPSRGVISELPAPVDLRVIG